MKTTINYQRVTVPEAFIAQSRQRVKQYGLAVYLRNGEEFEIELFNPTQSKVLAKIKINGNYISSSGIVLRPGERVFLERYIDEAKKFLFETYEVDGNDPNTREAIRNNGDVEVEFYEEQKINPYKINWQPQIWTYTDTTFIRPLIYESHTGTPNFNPSFTTSGDVKCENAASTYLCNISNTISDKSVETGRVEKGEYSDQSFGTEHSVYNSYYSWKSEWKILPDSQRQITKESLVIYCTNCGAKRKKSSHTFCPHCGARF